MLERNQSRSSYVPSMTPIFNDYDERKLSSKPQSPSGSQERISNLGGATSVSSETHFLQNFPAEIRRNLETQLLNTSAKDPEGTFIKKMDSDLFETMEKQMKNIMGLFAKERKSRRKEI